jgi:hypothetical protein
VFEPLRAVRTATQVFGQGLYLAQGPQPQPSRGNRLISVKSSSSGSMFEAVQCR